MLDPERFTPENIRVHLEHVGVQQVGHQIVLRTCRLIQGPLRSRKRWRDRSWCYCSSPWTEKTAWKNPSKKERNRGFQRNPLNKPLSFSLPRFSVNVFSLSLIKTPKIGNWYSITSITIRSKKSLFVGKGKKLEHSGRTDCSAWTTAIIGANDAGRAWWKFEKLYWK
jgi:hypothetical protein